ncbi:CHASE2 domain-containing protein [cf. Phormidesmis sp. LEGE 11477]|uniref:CHASE2 domain-containing protein n=1 Tax=cf. Phormidesmis sp. LEGE 11477 TaxID=1828680 RepID=UPI0018821302|nr:CHASE2 domain-containing protein [cf. Phormidesmis sp. LEGE 11477]MBE9060894.1 CHASE2 domain-containing protein [cf. Phormidesmis sp. LEGE 11477]
MDRRVTLKLNEGSLSSGFSVTLLIGDEGAMPSVDISGRLPAAPHLRTLYQQWQSAYRHLGGASGEVSGSATRLEADPVAYATNISLVGDCDDLANQLCAAFNQWLRADSFQHIRDKLLEHLNVKDVVRLILQTEPGIVQRLPWHLWEVCDRYPKLETTLSAATYEKSPALSRRTRSKIRILAIIGQSQGIDLKTDQDLLNRLPDAEVHFLTSPDLKTLSDRLWEPEGWDILFFAGHSATKSLKESVQADSSQTDDTQNASQLDSSEEAKQTSFPSIPTDGELYISESTPLILSSLKNPLKKAVARGLKIAIFNSCDGLGLAYALADFQISQVLIMREPVPDLVAHTFLKSFLKAFSQGESLALSVRDARERLQILESDFPCASWLPTLYQNPAEAPPTWSSLLAPASQPTNQPTQPTAPLVPDRARSPSRWLAGAAYLLTTAALLTVRSVGLLQAEELRAFDRLMRLRPAESPDPRIVVVTVTDADVEAQDPEDRRGSLADGDLLRLLTVLQAMQPRTIGLDIYRDYPVRENLPELATRLSEQTNFFGVCKSRDQQVGSEGIKGPPEMVGTQRTGFSDYLTDPDGVLRRQLVSLEPDPVSPCTARYGLSTLLAFDYLMKEGVDIEFGEDDLLRMDDFSTRPLEGNEGGYVNNPAQGWQMLLSYRSLPKPEAIAQQITLTEMLSGAVSPEAIRDRIVIIGTTASGFDDDQWLTPYSSVVGETKGVFMQAQMTSQMISAVLDGRPCLTTWNRWANILWISAWAGIGSLLMVALGHRRNHFLGKLALSLLISELALFGLCWLLLSRAAIWVPWVPAAIAPVAVATTTLALSRSSALSLNQSSSSDHLSSFTVYRRS